MNKVILRGNLTRDVEIKTLVSGMTVGNTGLAVNKKYKNKAGEKVEEVCFVDLTLWGRTAENTAKSTGKGSNILVEGELKLDQWETNEGKKASKLKVNVVNIEFVSYNKEKKDTKPAVEVTEEKTEDDIPF